MIMKLLNFDWPLNSDLKYLGAFFIWPQIQMALTLWYQIAVPVFLFIFPKKIHLYKLI